MKNLSSAKTASPLLVAALKRERALKKFQFKRLFKKFERVIL